MLTVKVTKQNEDENGKKIFSTRIVEAEQVDVHILRPNLYEVAANGPGDRSVAFYIAPRGGNRPEGFADEVDFWYEAFVENSAGATTQMIRL